jgi:general secretion pathway protein G
MLSNDGRPRPQPARFEAGYTLLELLVVLAILGLIIAIAAPRVMGVFEGSKAKAAKIEIANLAAAVELYRLTEGNYPASEQGIAALVEAPVTGTWGGPYLTRKSAVNDPWGRPYLYKTPGEHGSFDIWTLGADGKPGGTGNDQDLGSWE